jgi:Ca2+:H+ antiporter
MAIWSLVTGDALNLGLGGADMALLAVTVVVGALTVAPGRATLLQGGLHLAIMAGFVVLAVNP